MLATVCATVLASCGNNRPPAVYGGPPQPEPASWTTKLDSPPEGLLEHFATRGTESGCTVLKREPTLVSLKCPEADITMSQQENEITVSCNNVPLPKCRALFHRLGEAK